MERSVAIPCVVSARALWRAPYALTLIRVAPNTRKLVWADRKDLVIDTQSPVTEELSASLQAKVLRELEDAVVVSFRTRGIHTELAVSKAILGKSVNISPGLVSILAVEVLGLVLVMLYILLR